MTGPIGLHKHREAFCLMQYESIPETIGVDAVKSVCRRVVWNSRDGVTPFTFKDPETKVELQHVRFNEDQYAPNFEPPDDMIVWITVYPTLEECKTIARAIVKANPQYAPPPDDPLYEKFIERLSKSLMTQHGESGQPGLTTGLDYKEHQKPLNPDSKN